MEKLKLFERKIFRGVLALGMGGLALVGCGENGSSYEPSNPAIVVDHEYHRPYTSFIFAGKVLIPINNPERFHLDVRQCPTEADYISDVATCKDAHISVDKETYDSYPNGSTITLKN